MRKVEAKVSKTICLGRIGENLHTVVSFEESGSFLAMYPNASVHVLNKRPDDPAAYPVDPYFVRIEDGKVVWDVQSSDLAQKGCGQCELLFVEDQVVAKSVIYMTEILSALDATENPPEPWEDWVRRLINASEHGPYIQDGTWWVWDYSREEYVDTETPARGPQGEQGIQGETGTSITGTSMNNNYTLTVYFSNGTSYTTPTLRGVTGNGISNVVLNNNDTLTFTFTDGNSYTTPALRGPQGLKGDPFTVKKTFESIDEMESYDGDDLNDGDFIMISSNVSDEDNAKLYIKTDDGFGFITDLSGTQGMKGEAGRGISNITHNVDNTLTFYYTDGTSFTTGNIRGQIGLTPLFRVGTVTDLPAGSFPTVTIGGTPEYPVISFGIPHGASGNESIDDTAGVGDYDLVWSADKLERSFDSKADVPYVEQIESDVTDNKERLTDLETAILGNVASGEVIDGVAHFYNSDGDELFEITGIGGGGGGGGGSGDTTSVLTFTNNNGWASTTTPYGADLILSFTWSSLEDNVATGDGTATVVVNNAVRETRNIAQGNFTINVKDYLNPGTNKVTVTVTDSYGKSKPKNFTISVVNLSLSSTFDSSAIQRTSLNFPFTPYGEVSKTIHFELDGTELTPMVTSSSGRQMNYIIEQQSHGSHALRVWFTAVINNQTVTSNELYFEVVWVADGSTVPIISSDFADTTVNQYSTVTVPFMVYNPASLVSDVTILLDDEPILTMTDVGREMNNFTLRLDETGTHTITIASGVTEKDIEVTVSEVEMDVEAETENLALYLTSAGRSNLEQNPGTWEYTSGNTTISTEMTGFNFVTNGWVNDPDGITALRVNGGAQAVVEYKPFSTDFRAGGKTIEIEFAVRDVRDYSDILIDCMNGGRGFRLTAQNCTVAGEQSSLGMQYKDNEHIRVAFTYGKRSGTRLLLCYINGIVSAATQYPSDDDFTQITPQDITIGSENCTVDVYTIRVYDNDLTSKQIEDNWIADTQDGGLMLDRFGRNNIRDAYGNIVSAMLPSDLPYMTLVAAELPQFKGDKKKVDGSFINPMHPEKNFSFEQADFDVQGTSSQYYEVKNFKGKFKTGFINRNGQTIGKYQIRDDSIPVNVFTFKADVASSEGANNTILARIFNDTNPYKTPAQLLDSRVRQGIDGFPMVMFWTNSDNNTTGFVGKYNFNNDKSSEAVFGFEEGDESWEFKNNTSDRSLFIGADFESMGVDDNNDPIPDWLNDFEARYPDEDPAYTDCTQLEAFCKWVVSTDQSAATEEALPASKTYAGVTYTTDTAEYRLAKFKAELPYFAEINSFTYYYLFTYVMLLMDNRAKNMFLTFVGTTITSADKAIVPELEGMRKKATLPAYDFDSSLGINNEGKLVFPFWLEDIDQWDGADVYNGQQSVLWINFRAAYWDNVRTMWQNLRSGNTLSAPKTLALFDEHQGKWPEAVFNEDAYYKYLRPVENNNLSYLGMLLGSKKTQRDAFVTNRFRYIDSQLNAGDALLETVVVRAYAKANMTLTPALPTYLRVRYASYDVSTRATVSEPYTLLNPATNLNDSECIIYLAGNIADFGDLSGLKIGYGDFHWAVKAVRLQIGSADSQYDNPNLKELSIGTLNLLQYIDVRNASGLGTGDQKNVDLSGCSDIREAYFTGTSITGVTLPNGGFLKKLHLPDTISNLTIRNQSQLTEFVCEDFSHVTTLWLENPSSVIDTAAIVDEMPAGGRVRLYNFHWELEDLDDVSDMFDKLDNMRGLDQNGNNTDTPQVFGTINVEYAVGSQISAIQARYPDVRISYTHLTSNVYYYTWDGETLLATKQYVDGVGELYTGEPVRQNTEQYAYEFAGWALSTDQYEANENAFDDLDADRSVYAAYTRTTQTYTVTFKKASVDGGQTLQTLQNVPYGTTPVYTGSTPTSGNTDGGIYIFDSWDPVPGPITGNTTYTAVFNDVSVKIFYMNGNTLFATEKLTSGSNGSGPQSNPTKTSTAQYNFSFIGWNADSSATTADSNALKNVTADRTVYAVYSESLRSYTITFVKASEDGGGTLQTRTLAYGTMPSYTGTEPTSTQGDDYSLAGWTPALAVVTGDQTYTAVFRNGMTRPLIQRTIKTAEHSEATYIGSSAFYGCSSLTTASFLAATSIGISAFYSCYALTTAYFPAVTSIGPNAFAYCSALTTVSFPAATNIGYYAFTSCKSLTIAYFPAVTSIETSAFYNCTKLTTASFPAATSIGDNAFARCESLTTVSFPVATSIGGNAFTRCYSLTTAYFPAATSIGYGAFYYCTLLATAVFGNSSIVATLGDSAFYGANSITIYVPDNLVNDYKVASRWSSIASRIKGISELPT